LKVAVFTDVHMDLTARGPANNRHYHLADPLLRRLVDSLNSSIKPDAAIFAGDLLNRGSAEDAASQYGRAWEILNLLDCLLISLPGNHDGPEYSKIFGDDTVSIYDVKDTRFVLFRDPEIPGYNAERPEKFITYMKNAGNGHEGPLVSLQHVPVFPPAAADCPYHYTNAEKVIQVLREQGYCLALSGHYHEGFDFQDGNRIRYHAVPALCEPPFSFEVISFDGGRVSGIQQHVLEL
jgi:3',5'-cyclic AMP phosphodiesterase CpdA